MGALIKPEDVFMEQEQGWSVVTRNSEQGLRCEGS